MLLFAAVVHSLAEWAHSKRVIYGFQDTQHGESPMQFRSFTASPEPESHLFVSFVVCT